MIERVSSGVPGIDQQIQGGIPKGFSVFVFGPPGSGKSILGLQYLFEGVKKKEPGLYVTLESNLNTLQEQAKSFGWNPKGITFLSYSISDLQSVDVMQDVYDKVMFKIKPARLVFDSLTTYNEFSLPRLISKEHVPESIGGRYSTHLLLQNISSIGSVTSLFLCEKTSEIDLGEFLSDGVIELSQSFVGSTFSRKLRMPKMRMTSIDPAWRSFTISKRGISLSQA